MLNSKIILTVCLGLLLGACGGSAGFVPAVTAVKAELLQYGKTATILLGGKHLRSYLLVDTSQTCTNPSFASSSTTEVLVLNCTVQVVGDLPIRVATPEGQVIYTTTLSVPKPQVALSTSLGSITLELDPMKAPTTVNNFLNYVRLGYYKNTLFHRVISDFVIQGGGYTSGMAKKEGQLSPIVLESNNGLSNLRGTLAMARTNEPNSATSEFFINLVDNLSLDYKNEASPGYAVFGTVLQGLDVVDTIATMQTSVVSDFANVPTTEITITSVVQIK